MRWRRSKLGVEGCPGADILPPPRTAVVLTAHPIDLRRHLNCRIEVIATVTEPRQTRSRSDSVERRIAQRRGDFQRDSRCRARRRLGRNSEFDVGGARPSVTTSLMRLQSWLDCRLPSTCCREEQPSTNAGNRARRRFGCCVHARIVADARRPQPSVVSVALLGGGILHNPEADRP